MARSSQWMMPDVEDIRESFLFLFLVAVSPFIVVVLAQQTSLFLKESSYDEAKPPRWVIPDHRRLLAERKAKAKPYVRPPCLEPKNKIPTTSDSSASTIPSSSSTPSSSTTTTTPSTTTTTIPRGPLMAGFLTVSGTRYDVPPDSSFLTKHRSSGETFSNSGANNLEVVVQVSKDCSVYIEKNPPNGSDLEKHLPTMVEYLYNKWPQTVDLQGFQGFSLVVGQCTSTTPTTTSTTTTRTSQTPSGSTSVESCDSPSSTPPFPDHQPVSTSSVVADSTVSSSTPMPATLKDTTSSTSGHSTTTISPSSTTMTSGQLSTSGTDVPSTRTSSSIAPSSSTPATSVSSASTSTTSTTETTATSQMGKTTKESDDDNRDDGNISDSDISATSSHTAAQTMSRDGTTTVTKKESTPGETTESPKPTTISTTTELALTTTTTSQMTSTTGRMTSTISDLDTTTDKVLNSGTTNDHEGLSSTTLATETTVMETTKDGTDATTTVAKEDGQITEGEEQTGENYASNVTTGVSTVPLSSTQPSDKQISTDYSDYSTTGTRPGDASLPLVTFNLSEPTSALNKASSTDSPPVSVSSRTTTTPTSSTTDTHYTTEAVKTDSTTISVPSSTSASTQTTTTTIMSTTPKGGREGGLLTVDKESFAVKTNANFYKDNRAKESIFKSGLGKKIEITVRPFCDVVLALWKVAVYLPPDNITYKNLDGSVDKTYPVVLANQYVGVANATATCK